MPNRRMFSKTITNSSRFLMMPSSTQALYFHLGMNADDDGFCEHFTIMRMTDAKPDDLRILQAKGFIKIFDDQVLVILDWRENNAIRKDRYTPSRYLQIYKEELKKIGLEIGQLPAVNHLATNGQPAVANRSTRYKSEHIEPNYKDTSESNDKTDSSPIITLQLNGQTKEFQITQEMIELWQEDYPNVNVLLEIKKMHAWLDANPQKRKTNRGIKRFIVSWLSRAQDNSGGSRQYQDRYSKNQEAVKGFLEIADKNEGV